MVPTPLPGDSSNRAASTAFVAGAAAGAVAEAVAAIAANFASPPPIGNVTPNSIVGTSFSKLGSTITPWLNVVADYGADPTGVVIDDHNLNTIASLPGVSAALNGSKFIIADGAAPTYHGAVGAAGAVVTPVFVSGGVYVYD
ncbi:MAG: hypothetical protein ACRECH_13540 [Nitrososphaerales archaeon]